MIFLLPRVGLEPRLPFSYSGLPRLSSREEEWARVLGRDSVLEDGGRFGEYRVVRFAGTCATKKPSGAKTVPTALLSYELWVKGGGNPPFACCFSPRYLAHGIMLMFSQATYGEPGRFSPRGLRKGDFQGMMELVLGRRGRVNWLAVRGVKAGGGMIRRMEVIGPGIHGMTVRCPRCGHEWEWLRASLESPGVQIQKMGFVLEALSWTLADWGGGQLSSPLNPEREDLLRFLDILE
jgi:hypothetical protein